MARAMNCRVILLAATQFLTQASGFQGGTSHVLLTGAGSKFLAALPAWRNQR
jgi:hypothetical protein